MCSLSDNPCHISPSRGPHWREHATSQRHAPYRNPQKYTINHRLKQAYTSPLHRFTTINLRRSHTASYPQRSSTIISHRCTKCSDSTFPAPGFVPGYGSCHVPPGGSPPHLFFSNPYRSSGFVRCRWAFLSGRYRPSRTFRGLRTGCLEAYSNACLQAGHLNP